MGSLHSTIHKKGKSWQRRVKALLYHRHLSNQEGHPSMTLPETQKQ
jgi:hypothetical protein